jgi:hypothetical protein
VAVELFHADERTDGETWRSFSFGILRTRLNIKIMLNTDHFITGCGWDRNTLIESWGKQWKSDCYESRKGMEEAPTSFTHTYTWHTHCEGLQQNDTNYDIWIPIIFLLSSTRLSLRDSVLHFAYQLFSRGIMRQDVIFRSETWEVLFTNILGSVGDVINMQTQGLILIIRRKYTDRKQHGRMHWQ